MDGSQGPRQILVYACGKKSAPFLVQHVLGRVLAPPLRDRILLARIRPHAVVAGDEVFVAASLDAIRPQGLQKGNAERFLLTARAREVFAFNRLSHVHRGFSWAVCEGDLSLPFFPLTVHAKFSNR